MPLSEDQIQRYARHILLPEVGGRGQSRLLASRARIVGAGRAAEEALIYLAAAGVGQLVVDGRLLEGTGPRVGQLNPDVRLVADRDEPDPEALDVSALGDRRADGALAAMAALIAMAGVRDGSFEWHTEPLEASAWHA